MPWSASNDWEARSWRATQPSFAGAAVAWREEAARLSELESELERQVQSTLADTWQGQASRAFADTWGSLAAKLQELATGYGRGATSLEQAAARATDLNQQVARLAEEIQRLLASLHSVQELGAAVGLTGQAEALVRRLEELLRQVDAASVEFLDLLMATMLRFEHVRPSLPRRHPVSLPKLEWEISMRLAPGTFSELRPPAAGAGEAVLPGGWNKGGIDQELSRWVAALAALAALASVMELMARTRPDPSAASRLIEAEMRKAESALLPRLSANRSATVDSVGGMLGELERWVPWLWYKPPSKDLPAFPDAKRADPKTPVRGGKKLRARWQDSDGNIYEWDYQHGSVEKYDRRGNHKGEFDPGTGKQLKSPDQRRRVRP